MDVFCSCPYSRPAGDGLEIITALRWRFNNQAKVAVLSTGGTFLSRGLRPSSAEVIKRVYLERYQERYGFWRSIIDTAVRVYRSQAIAPLLPLRPLAVGRPLSGRLADRLHGLPGDQRSARWGAGHGRGDSDFWGPDPFSSAYSRVGQSRSKTGCPHRVSRNDAGGLRPGLCPNEAKIRVFKTLFLAGLGRILVWSSRRGRPTRESSSNTLSHPVPMGVIEVLEHANVSYSNTSQCLNDTSSRSFSLSATLSIPRCFPFLQDSVPSSLAQFDGLL